MAHEPGERLPENEETRRLTKGEIRWIIGGVLAILFGVFIAQNADETPIDFLFFSLHIRLIWIFLICAVLGAVIDRLLQRRGLLPTIRRKRKQEEERHAKDQ
jgi:uncharacterized integral membrane protein